MIRCGMLCKTCSPKECREEPTEIEPIEIECPECEGNGCDQCNDGFCNVPECPKAYCQSVVPALDLIDLFHQGMPPVAGGSLDQTQWFLDAAKILKNDELAIKAERRNG